MSQKIAGTFVSTASRGIGATSDVLIIPTDKTSAVLDIAGPVDANNTVASEKSANGLDWTTVSTYTSAQTGTSVGVAEHEHWRLRFVASEINKAISYSLSVES